MPTTDKRDKTGISNIMNDESMISVASGMGLIAGESSFLGLDSSGLIVKKETKLINNNYQNVVTLRP